MPKSPHNQKFVLDELPDELVAAARRGAYLKALSYGASHADADDIAQESLVAALFNVAEGKIDASDLVPWVIGIARKSVATHARSEGRRAARQRRFHREAEVGSTNVDDPERILGLQWVADQVDSLPPRQRAVIMLALAGYSNNEIAARLEIEAGTVRTHQAAGHKALAARLNTPHD